MVKNCISILLVFFCNFTIKALVPPLEREINLSFNNEQIAKALSRIEDQTGLVFSYKPSIISHLGPVTLQLVKKTVREALSVILPKSIVYKSKSNYIILKEIPVQKQSANTQISGYIVDQNTQQKVANVSIYDKQSLQSATSDEYGYYSIKIPTLSASVSINKENYKDTVMRISNTQGDALTTIRISQLPDSITKRDSLFWQERWSEVNEFSKLVFQKFRGYVNTINIKDTLSRKFQVSVFPFIGTNHRMSGNVYNRLSLNIYGGYAKGLNGFELGGLFNIEKENVKGVQIAGLLNVVGDSVKGSQVAGLMNITGKSAEGFQAAGLMNINEGAQSGFQAATLMNISTRSKGTSAAGLMNIATKAEGAQIAVLANITDTLRGIAVAGLFNVCGEGSEAVQIAGLFNVAESGKSNLQISGLFNRTSYLKGVQIAPFNFADSAKGVPIGLLNFVKSGVHQLELSADEMFLTNLSLRTGVNAFYNVLTVGMQPASSTPIWHFGYGLGTSFKIKNKWRSDITLSMHHLSKGQMYFATSELYRFYWGVEYRFGKKFSIAAGPTFNMYMTDALLPDYTPLYSDIGPKPLFEVTDADDYNTKAWIGAKFCLRFL